MSKYDTFFKSEVKTFSSGKNNLPYKMFYNPSLAMAYNQELPDMSEERLKGIEDIVSKSPVGKKILERAKAVGVEIALDCDLNHDVGGIYSAQQNAIFLNAYIPNAGLASTLVHESRHAGQAHSGICLADDLDVKSFFMVGFAGEADAVACESLFAYQVKEIYPKVWEKLNTETYAPVTKALEQTMNEKNDPKLALNNAFETWYKLGVVKHYGQSYVNWLRFAVNSKESKEAGFFARSFNSKEITDTFCSFNKKSYAVASCDLTAPEKLFLPHNDKKSLDKMVRSWAKKVNRPCTVGTEAIFSKQPDDSFKAGEKIEPKKNAFEVLFQALKKNKQRSA